MTKDNGKDEQKLADRTGTWTPDQKDRRRLAVSEVIMVAAAQDGMVMPSNMITAVQHNILDEKDDPDGMDALQLAEGTTLRLRKIAQGGAF